MTKTSDFRKFIESASSQVSESVSGSTTSATVEDPWAKLVQDARSGESDDDPVVVMGEVNRLLRKWDEYLYPAKKKSEQMDPTSSKEIVNQLLEKWKKDDQVEHPPHYNQHPSGVECIEVAEHLNFCRGNAIKYIWRAGEKDDELEDLKKARWYLDREIKRLTQESRPYLK